MSLVLQGLGLSAFTGDGRVQFMVRELRCYELQECSQKKKRYTPMFTAALFTNNQDTEATYMSINGWMDKEDVGYKYIHIYTHTQWYLIQLQIRMKFCHLQQPWRDLEGIMLSKTSQTKTNTVWYHLYVKSKIIKQTSEYNKKETDSQV